MTNNSGMKQQDLGLKLSTRRTRKEVLLDEMGQVMPWAELVALIGAHAPVAPRVRLVAAPMIADDPHWSAIHDNKSTFN